jgi:aldehyde:ferredoxin oxidoreductase
VRVQLPPDVAGAPERETVIDRPVESLAELREALDEKLPEGRDALADETVNLCLNGSMVLSGEKGTAVRDGDTVALVRTLAGG